MIAVTHRAARIHIAANLDSMFLAFIRLDLWLQPEAHGTKTELQLHRSDSEDTIWFIALAEEQLTLITENGLHVVPFIFARTTVSLWAASAEADDVSFADM